MNDEKENNSKFTDLSVLGKSIREEDEADTT